jgi:hypothetical protein
MRSTYLKKSIQSHLERIDDLEALELVERLVRRLVNQNPQQADAVASNEETDERKFTKMHVLFFQTNKCLTIDLNNQKVVGWDAQKPRRIQDKVRDELTLLFETLDGRMLCYQGYVPDFFPGEHYGDYLMLEFTTNGRLKDFEPTDAEITELLEEASKFYSDVEEDEYR